MENKQKEESIFEIVYYTDFKCIIQDGKWYHLLASEDTWIFPWKPKRLRIGVNIRIPKNTQAILNPSPIANHKNIMIQPEVLIDGQFICPLVRKFGILPKKIKKGDFIGIITLTPLTELNTVHNWDLVNQVQNMLDNYLNTQTNEQS